MRRVILITLAVATLAATGWAARAATTEPGPSMNRRRSSAEFQLNCGRLGTPSHEA